MRRRHKDKKVFDLTTPDQSPKIYTPRPRVYIIVKYFDPDLEYHFNDRESGSGTFTSCRITRDWWVNKEDADRVLQRITSINPNVGYGIALVVQTEYKNEGRN